jgi:acetyl esterase/lipase
VLERKLPLPAAVALIAEGATERNQGDSFALMAPVFKATSGIDLSDAVIEPYYEGVDVTDHHVTPALSDALMSSFPPAFLASSTRDFCLSPVVATHRALCRLSVPAELHIWEGLEHFFHANNELPEARELHLAMMQFFNRHLACS